MIIKITETKVLTRYRHFFVCLFIVVLIWAAVGIVIHYLPDNSDTIKVCSIVYKIVLFTACTQHSMYVLCSTVGIYVCTYILHYDTVHNF
jgi:hypothetical protein